MKFGFSSYSFHQRISTGDMSLFDVIDWVADSQGEHLELAVLSNSAQNTIPTVESDPDYVRAVKTRAADRGVTRETFSTACCGFCARARPGRICRGVIRRIRRATGAFRAG